MTLPTWVALDHADPVVGNVNTDRIEQIGRDEFDDYLGSLTPTTMRRVDDALRTALAL